MIALDASTAVQPFRDLAYDIGELAEKLQELLSEAGYVSFKYADGSVVSVPSAALVQAMVPSFARLLLGGGLSLEIEGGALSIKAIGGDGALEALVSEHVAGSASISGSHIEELVVSGSLSIRDLSQWAAANGLAGKRLSATRVSGAASARAGSVSTRSAYTSEGLSAKQATLRGEWAASPTSSATGLLSPNAIGLYDGSSSIATEIVLSSGSMSLTVPSRGASSVTVAIHCSIPYHTAAGWERLEVDSYSVDRGDSTHVEAARGAMTGLLLWPSWKMEGPSISDRTFRVYPGGPMTGEAPIVRVRNTTDGTLWLPHVWAFTKRADGKGSVEAVSYIKLPPYSCKEFEFRHSEDSNCGYMYPLSIW